MRIICVGFLFISAALAATQTLVKPYKIETGIKATVISTTKFNPQVREIKGQTNREVENEFELPKTAPAERNTLALGAISDLGKAVMPGASFPGIDATGWVPPDPDLAVGPTHIVNTVNVALAFFKRDGTKTFQQDLGQQGFFQGTATAGFVFDPKCFYDQVSKRFFVLGLEQDDTNKISGLCLAVSDDSDPNGNWFRYRIEAKQTVNGADFWLDYPGFGFSKDAIMITGNMFGFAGGFNGIQFIVIPKAPLLTGAPVTAAKFTQPGGSAQVMRTPNDPNTPIIYAMNFADASNARLYAIQSPGTANPTLTAINVGIPTFDGPSRGGISVANHVLDSLDGRVFNLQYRGGKLWAAHGIQASASDDRCVGRWYEMNLRGWPTSGNNPTFTQGGNVGNNGQDFILPAICPNAIGEIALVSTRCSTSIVADFVIAARRSTDPAGTMRAPVKLAGSIGSQYGGTSNRWGDYFGLQTDPLDDVTFWGVGMVANASGGWVTRIENFRLTLPFTNAPSTIAKYEGGTPTGSIASVTNSDNSYYTVPSTAILRTGQVASATADFNVPPTFELGLKAEAKAITGVTGSVFFYNWTTAKYDYIGSMVLTTADSTKLFSIGANYASYINNQHKVRVLYRAVYPPRTGSTTPSYTLRIDWLQLQGAS